MDKQRSDATCAICCWLRDCTHILGCACTAHTTFRRDCVAHEMYPGPGLAAYSPYASLAHHTSSCQQRRTGQLRMGCHSSFICPDAGARQQRAQLSVAAALRVAARLNRPHAASQHSSQPVRAQLALRIAKDITELSICRPCRASDSPRHQRAASAACRWSARDCIRSAAQVASNLRAAGGRSTSGRHADATVGC
jgi:hypothetical protein